MRNRKLFYLKWSLFFFIAGHIIIISSQFIMHEDIMNTNSVKFLREVAWDGSTTSVALKVGQVGS